ncbi:MAG: WbqC family protein [Planctomyces sp.]|jgi:hypothetical protein
MRLGMMQPYFFPYVGYFSLIHATDHWVVFDSAQYIRRGWVNRNRILSTGESPWKYIRIPVQHADMETRISEILIDGRTSWINSLIQNLDYYRLKKAPFHRSVSEWLQETLRSAIEDSAAEAESPTAETTKDQPLAPALLYMLKETCRYIGLRFHYQLYSELSGAPDYVADAGHWALEVAKIMNASHYINAPGGRSLFNPVDFETAGIQLSFLEPHLTPYEQKRPTFEPALSIIDLLMWNSPADTRTLVEQYTVQP